MRTQEADGRDEFAAGFAPAEFGIDDIALQEIGCAKMFTEYGNAVELVIGHVAVHRAGDHVTATYAATLAPQVGQAVDDALGR